MFENTFQAIFITVFILLGVAGIAVFAINPGLIGVGSIGPQPVSIDVWGTVSEENFSATLTGAGISDDDTLTVEYTEISPRNLRDRLVNQLAKDRGPDVILMPHTQLVQLQEFLITFGPETYDRREFRNNFVQGTEIFTNPNGVVALPFSMDPLVMYWNRDILSANGFVSPPKTWNDIQPYIDRITEVDEVKNINKSAIALGTADNIEELKSIISSILMQAGNSITERQDGGPSSVLLADQVKFDAAEAAVRLYTQFANPSANTYTWNDTFNSDRQLFISNDLGMHFGVGSEITNIREQNPNLNFDIAKIPQREGNQPRTYAKMYGLAMLDRVHPQRRNRLFTAIKRLSGRNVADSLLQNTNLTPVRKSVVSQANPDLPHKQTYLDIAPTARGWLDPGEFQTQGIFRNLIANVTSGRYSIQKALQIADGSLQSSMSEYEN